MITVDASLATTKPSSRPNTPNKFVFPVCRVFIAVLWVITIFTGCSRLEVTSEPAEARVLWSPNGYNNWQPWPPRAWEEEELSEKPDVRTAPVTPFKKTGVYGDTVWVTVEKEGFYRPLPKAAQLYALRSEKLFFSLRETPEAFSARMQADGYVEWNGEWVRPAEHNLVEFEGVWMTQEKAFRLGQIGKGLVELDGEWLTKEQAQAQFDEQQRAKGLILFKDRWMAPEVMAQEERLDQLVAEIASTNPVPLDLPKVVGPVEGNVAQIQILNSTDRQVRLIMSGPQSREFILTPYSSVGLAANERLRIVPGRYEIVILPELTLAESSASVQNPTLVPAESHEARYLEASLAKGFQYLINYDIETGFGEGDVDEYRAVEPELPIETPEIEVPEVELPERPQRGRWPGAGGSRPGGTRGGAATNQRTSPSAAAGDSQGQSRPGNSRSREIKSPTNSATAGESESSSGKSAESSES